MNGTRLHWFGNDRFELDSVEFHVRLVRNRRDSERFGIAKPRPLVEKYVDLIDQIRPKRIFELGIHAGGGTALMALLADPDRLIAVDLDPDPPPALEAFRRARGLEQVIEIHCGVDQSDRQRLGEIADEGLDGEPLDLVIDDASHEFEQTKASFEVLFPRLRPGGLYCIEDWNWHHGLHEAMKKALEEDGAQAAALRERFRKSSQAAAKALPATSVSMMAGLLRGEDTNGRTNVANALIAAARDDTNLHHEQARSVLEAAATSLGEPWNGDLLTQACVDTDDPRHRQACNALARALQTTESPRPTRRKPLSRFAVDLLLVQAGSSTIVHEFRIDKHWILVVKGDGDIGPATFRIEDHMSASIGLMDD